MVPTWPTWEGYFCAKIGKSLQFQAQGSSPFLLRVMPNAPKPGRGFRIAHRGGVRRTSCDLYRTWRFGNIGGMPWGIVHILLAIRRYIPVIRTHASRTFGHRHTKPKDPTMSGPSTRPSFLDLPPGEEICRVHRILTCVLTMA